MPRIRRGLETARGPKFPDLVEKLAGELRNAHDVGQPRIEEKHFPETGAIHVTVIWDRWEPVPDEDRTPTILEAYEEVEGRAFRDRIMVALGLTVPEADEGGFLPFAITTAWRQTDPVTLAQCQDAMRQEGASTLNDPGRPELRFATQEEAEACLRRLKDRLPGSDPVWMITREVARIID